MKKIKTALLKNKEDLTKFEQEVDHRFYTTPDEYPAIIIAAPVTPHGTWSEMSFSFNMGWEVKFLYPDEIQKELYKKDFDDMVNK